MVFIIWNSVRARQAGDLSDIFKKMLYFEPIVKTASDGHKWFTLCITHVCYVLLSL